LANFAVHTKEVARKFCSFSVLNLKSILFK